MLSFRTAAAPAGPGKSKNYRKRVISVQNSGNILYAVASSNKTEIVLVNSEGKSLTVLAFNSYMDIVAADLSEDQCMIAYTERFCRTSKFTFRTVLRHIHSFANVNVFEDSFPIESYFVPSGTESTYHIIHSVGSKVFHCRAIFVPPKTIEVRQVRNGMNIMNCTKWGYNRAHNMFYVIRGQCDLGIYKFARDGMQTSTHQIESDPSSILPPELALLPSVPSQLPVYKFSRGNIFVVPVGNDCAVFEQIYKGEETSLTFSVEMVRHKCRKVVTVPGVQPDLPVNYIAHDLIVFVFAVNSFLTMIDLTTRPPNVYMLPKVLSQGPTSNCTASVPGSNVVVDLESGDVYQCELSMHELPTCMNYSDRMTLTVFAILASRASRYISIGNLIQKLSEDAECLLFFLGELFDIGMAFKRRHHVRRKDLLRSRASGIMDSKSKVPKEVLLTLEEYEREFPSDGDISRVEYFYGLLIQMKRSGASPFNITQKALQHLSAQNRIALTLRAGIDQWVEVHNPPLHMKFFISLCVLSESCHVPCPAIPCLKQEIESESYEVCPEVMRAQIRENHLAGFGYNSGEIPESDKEEIEYWNLRLPSELFEGASVTAGHSSRGTSSNGSTKNFELPRTRSSMWIRDSRMSSSSSVMTEDVSEI